MADEKKLKQDLIAVLDEHDVTFLSVTITESKKKMHGSLNFEDVLEGDKQERLKMRAEAGTTEQA